jgi:hypothetical protein
MNSESNLATSGDFQSEHLFLLMGENPLPNLVAILALLKPSGIPYLIHTQRTKTQAVNLADSLAQLKTYQCAQLLDLGENQAEAFVVRQLIQTHGQALTGKVGLNYTGGTKAMAVHAYRALAELYADAIFSYLDAMTQEMVIDNDVEPSHRFKPRVKIPLEAIIRLHGWQWRQDKPPLFKPVQPLAAQEFAQIYESNRSAGTWRRWCFNHLGRAKTNKGNWLCEDELENLEIIDLRELPPKFKQLLHTYFNATDTHLPLAQSSYTGFTSRADVCAWLDGVWLEHYTLSQVQMISRDCQIHNSGLSFHIQKFSTIQDENARERFELDILFMHFHQLFAISCTTSADRKCLTSIKMSVERQLF